MSIVTLLAFVALIVVTVFNKDLSVELKEITLAIYITGLLLAMNLGRK